MVVEIAALAHRARLLLESGVMVSTRFRASIVGYEVGMIGAGCLWGLRRKMRKALADCHRLIVGGGNRGLRRAGPGYRMVFDCEDPELDIVLAAAGMVVLDQHMKKVGVHFEVETVALECESLSL